MTEFWIKIIIYLFSFVSSLYGLAALDFNRFLRKGKVANAQILYFLLAIAMAYLVGSFIINISYYINN